MLLLPHRDTSFYGHQEPEIYFYNLLWRLLDQRRMTSRSKFCSQVICIGSVALLQPASITESHERYNNAHWSKSDISKGNQHSSYSQALSVISPASGYPSSPCSLWSVRKASTVRLPVDKQRDGIMLRDYMAFLQTKDRETTIPGAKNHFCN